MRTIENRTLVCRSCDALTTIDSLPSGGVAYCPCCRSRLLSNPSGSLHIPLALMVGSLILFVIANIYPLLVLKMGNGTQAATLIASSTALWDAGMQPLALFVLLSTVLAPGFVIAASLYLLSALYLRRALPASRFLLKLIHSAEIWGMIDVFMLGMLVALMKLSDTADLLYGTGFFAFIFVILFFTAASVKIDVQLWWEDLGSIGSDNR